MAKVLSILKEKKMETDHSNRKPEPKVRSPHWKFQDIEWENELENNVFYRTYLGGLSLLFPEGERYFIRSVKENMENISDERLLKDIKGFIGQEGQHGRLHELMNQRALGDRYEINGFLKQWTGFAFEFLEPLARKVLPKSLLVSITAAAEHFTAAWAVNALTAPVFTGISNPQLHDLIQWHAIEEIEHKHVAFDVLREADDSSLTRAAGMAITGPLIGFLSFWGAFYLLAQEEDIDWQQYFGTLLKEATDSQGMLRIYLQAFVEYFKPGFHPSDHDDYYLASEVAEALEARIKDAKKKPAQA